MFETLGTAQTALAAEIRVPGAQSSHVGSWRFPVTWFQLGKKGKKP